MRTSRSKLPPDYDIFLLEDGRKYGAHKHSCLFCNHCTDIFYDSNGIYALICDINCNDQEIMEEHKKSSFYGKCEYFKEEEK